MTWEAEAAGYLAELARQPAARQPATIGEIWDAEWRRGGLDTVSGVAAPHAEAANALSTAIESAAGQPIGDYARAHGVRLYGATSSTYDADELRQLALTLPEDKQKTIAPLIDVRLNAAKKAQAIETEAADVAGATYGLSGHAVAFLAGVARQSADPVNVAAMIATAPLGGAGGAGIAAAARVIGREAAANAAAQAAVEPIIEPARADLGLDSGFDRAVGNILEAGIGGGVLGGLFHAAGRGLHAMRGGRPAEAAPGAAPEGTIQAPAAETRTGQAASAPEARFDPPPAGPLAPPRPAEQFAAEDFQAAAHLAERDHVVDAMSPVDTPEGRIEHAAKVESTLQRLEQAASQQEAPRVVYRGEPLPDVGVVPANLARDGTIYVGPKNSQHFQISEKFSDQVRTDLQLAPGEYTWKDTGFVNPQGEFLTREQALKWVNTHEKKIRPAENMGDELDALDYREQVPEARRSSGLVAVKPKILRGRAAADPATFSIFEHLASAGGLRPDPELAAIFGNKRGPFVPGFGPLIRKGGRTIDDALRSAKDAGYLFDPHDAGNGTAGSSGRVGLGLIQRDLLDVLDAESRGNKLYRAGHMPEAKIDTGEEAHAIMGALERELHETSGGDIAVDLAIANRVVEIVRKEGETDVLAAYERAIMEDAERYEGLAAARQADAELAKIPGWDADEPGAASRDGATDPQQRRPAERAGQGTRGKDGAAARDAGEGAGASRQLGDPALAADAARAMEDAGGDLDITLQNPDGTTRTLKASDALREVENDARAADELNACIAGAAGDNNV